MYYFCSAGDTFKLQNRELNSFKIVNSSDETMTLVSVRYAEGITFTEDDTTNRLRAYGLCVTTGSGIAYSQT